jgi:hypothetical protein
MTNPVFKTFYNHRVFVIYEPEHYRQYLLRIVESNWPDSERFGLRLGLMAWGTILVYQARMVASDFHRRLKGLVNAEGEFLHQNPSLPLTRPFYRQQLAMQLGIEVIARTPEVKERIGETPIIAQYVYDTLYLPSFYHERGLGQTSAEGAIKSFELTRDGLREHLWLRSGGEPNKPEAKTFIAPATVDYLFRGVLDKYFKLLSEPKKIQEKTRQYASELPSDDRRLWLALADVVDDGRALVEYERHTPAPQSTAPQAQQPDANKSTPPNG